MNNTQAMCEVKDPAIKLFGKIIALPKSDSPATLHRKSDATSQIPVTSDPKVCIHLSPCLYLWLINILILFCTHPSWYCMFCNLYSLCFRFDFYNVELYSEHLWFLRWPRVKPLGWESEMVFWVWCNYIVFVIDDYNLNT